MGKHEIRRVPGTGVHPSLVPHLFDGTVVLEEAADEVGTLVTDEDEAAAEASLVLAGEADESALDEYGTEPADYRPRHARRR